MEPAPGQFHTSVRELEPTGLVRPRDQVGHLVGEGIDEPPARTRTSDDRQAATLVGKTVIMRVPKLVSPGTQS